MAFAVPLSPRGGNASQVDPLSADHRRQLAAAREQSRVIRKAARVANFNGWTTAVIAALSLPFSLSSPVGLALTAGLAFVAFNEFRGRKRILSFDPTGATLLGWNQLGLLAMITAYCLWMMVTSLDEASAVATEVRAYADLDAALGSTGGFSALIKVVAISFYGVVIFLSVLFQGATAWYYFSRRRRIADFVAQTPEWIRELQRGGSLL